ncbi:hypothetical protein PybrP1_007583 [[Pythium] brassicae (nom. inval.)]|nr:hypothetical protein PybrP1_007583 [[Pythium] brassicae (nom. inval.)]
MSARRWPLDSRGTKASECTRQSRLRVAQDATERGWRHAKHLRQYALVAAGDIVLEYESKHLVVALQFWRPPATSPGRMDAVEGLELKMKTLERRSAPPTTSEQSFRRQARAAFRTSGVENIQERMSGVGSEQGASGASKRRQEQASGIEASQRCQEQESGVGGESAASRASQRHQERVSGVERFPKLHFSKFSEVNYNSRGPPSRSSTQRNQAHFLKGESEPGVRKAHSPNAGRALTQRSLVSATTSRHHE